MNDFASEVHHIPQSAYISPQPFVVLLLSTIWRRGRGAMARSPDCLASHACVLVPNPAVHVWGVQRNIIVSPFSGEHVNGGLVQIRLRPVYRR